MTANSYTEVPTLVPDVPTKLLTPRNTWADGDAYDAQANWVAAMFRENFTKFEDPVSAGVLAAGPQI